MAENWWTTRLDNKNGLYSRETVSEADRKAKIANSKASEDFSVDLKGVCIVVNVSGLAKGYNL